MPGLMIGIPTLESRPIHIDWAFAFKGINPPLNYNTIFSCIKNQPVAIARNLIAEEAVRQNCKYLFFLGDDTIPPPHALRQLIFRMENTADLAMCGGIYCSKTNPPTPLVFRGNGEGSFWDWKMGEFFEVTGIGMDCTIIRVSALQKLVKPWFLTIDTDKHLDGINNAEMWTEDLYFCKRVTDAGMKIYADAMVLCDHIDVFKNITYRLPAYSLPTRMPIANGKKIVDLGCGLQKRDFGEEGTAITVDICEDYMPDYRCDVRQLPFGNSTFDVAFSSHVLEHIPRSDVNETLKEWVRILKPDGELRLILPNIAWAAKKVLENTIDHHTLNVLYGGQSNPYDYHYNGFTKARLEELLTPLNFELVSYEEQGYNMLVTAKKGVREL